MKKALKYILAWLLSLAMTLPIYTLFYFFSSQHIATLAMGVCLLAFWIPAKRIVFRKKGTAQDLDTKAANIHSAEASPKAPRNNDCSNVKEQELEETVSNITDQELLEIENQLRTCDTKDLFFKYYQMFAYSPHLSENSSRSPITAAYLFVIFDCIAFAQNKREKSYEILSLIEKEILSQSELDCYDKCVNIFGAVARGEIAPRGDWMFFDGDTGGNWLYALYLCYGDLIRYPAYLSDYEHHPIIIHDYFELMKFSDNFSKTILLFTREFADVFSHRLG
ncbi:MAG: hypothetical protein IJX46_07690 [Clostridia bacterium]|nr:hypothetical protein [Clostridia bacterium]